jgi:ribosomal protein S24E
MNQGEEVCIWDIGAKAGRKETTGKTKIYVS